MPKIKKAPVKEDEKVVKTEAKPTEKTATKTPKAPEKQVTDSKQKATTKSAKKAKCKLSGYDVFCREELERNVYDKLTLEEKMKKIGQRWKALSTNDLLSYKLKANYIISTENHKGRKCAS